MDEKFESCARVIFKSEQIQHKSQFYGLLERTSKNGVRTEDEEQRRSQSDNLDLQVWQRGSRSQCK